MSEIPVILLMLIPLEHHLQTCYQVAFPHVNFFARLEVALLSTRGVNMSSLQIEVLGIRVGFSTRVREVAIQVQALGHMHSLLRPKSQPAQMMRFVLIPDSLITSNFSDDS